MAAVKSLFQTLSPLIVIRDPGDNPTPPIGTTDQRITTRITIDQVLTPINDFAKNEHTGSSRYASAESEEESNDLFATQRILLGPSGADLLRTKLELN